MTYLVKASQPKRGRNSVLSAEQLQVSFARRYRAKRDLGFATEVEVAGIDRERLELYAPDAVRGDGRKAHAPWARSQCEATAPAVKRVVRRLRPQESEAVEILDARIAEKLRELGALRDERDELLRRAFSRGHVITLSELVEKADAFEAALRER